MQNLSRVKQHAWCKDIEWAKVLEKKLKPPFKPHLHKSNFDEQQFAQDVNVLTLGQNGVCNRLRSSAQTTLHTFAR